MRAATVEDIPRLLEMGRKFHEAKENNYPFNNEDATAFLKAMIESGFVMVSRSGFIIGAISGAPVNQEYRTAYELFWWSEGRDGFRLRKAFEEWAQGEGCSDVVFSHPEGEDMVNRMLTRAGYGPQARTLRRALKCA